MPSEAQRRANSKYRKTEQYKEYKREYMRQYMREYNKRKRLQRMNK